jgi:hypothetical protein
VQDTIVTIFGTGIVFAFSALIVGIIFYARHREKQLRHETIRLALEKGQALPPELLQGGARTQRSDLSRGVLLLSVGAGLTLFLAVERHRGWGAGLVLVCLGLGYLVSHALGRRAPAPAEPPPAAQ